MPYVKSAEFLKKYPMIWNDDNWNDYVECTNGKYKFTIPFDLDPSHLDIDYEHGKCPSELEPLISGRFLIDNIIEFTEPFEVEFSTMYDATELYFYKWDGYELSIAVVDYLSKYEELLESRSKITKDERDDEYSIFKDMLENKSVDKRFRPSKNDWEVIYKEDVEKKRSKKQKSSIKIKKDGDINAKDKEGKTALIRAVENGETETVSSLIDKGCDIEARDENQWTGGWTALMWAARKGLTETVELLINKGADIEAKTKAGTALIIAASNRQAGTAKLLIDKGANIHVKDDFGCTALIAVAYAGPREIIELLIDKGADIEAKDNDGKTPLIQAASNGETETVALLLEKGADVNVKDNDGSTALSIAAKEGYTAIVKLLKKAATGRGSKDLPGKNKILTQKKAKKLEKTKRP
jgi:ankyrin repeat protein